MILNLVDRRTTGPRETDWMGANLTLLNALADRVGPAEWSVNLVLVDDAQMTRLNREYRQIDGVTDVLSFSYLSVAEAGQGELAAGELGAAVDLALDEAEAEEGADECPVVGEVILAPGFVTARCGERDWPADLEFPMLVVHGLLHILGWDHMEDEEREAMQALEESILVQEKLTHPLRKRS